MTTNITILNTAPNLTYLVGTYENAEIKFCGSPFHEITWAGKKMLLDIKDVRVTDKVQLQGWLQHEDNLGQAIVELN